MKLQTILIDDEPLGLRILADDLQKVPTIQIMGQFTKPFEGLELIQQGKVDLLFLDIQMPLLLGTDFLRSLAQPPMVIFTTAYEHYAVEGFELNAIDYLLKPIRLDRLLRACNKAYEHYSLKQKIDAIPQADTFFFVKTEYKETKIYHQDILYIEGLKDYVKIHLESLPGKPILTRLNMKAMEALLEPNQFCRVHQSYIVPMRRITAFHKTQILLGSTVIPVGERYADQFLAIYRNR
ncbi:MAG: response regulator transcription factor [Bacteroidetes bacterium]|nr:response regulator transcription factor [Fibrella sp.]